MSREPDGITIPDRLDAALVALGLVESRSKAQRLIKAGKVMVDGTVITKSSQSIASAADIAIDKGDDYVSRGAYKLIGAFEAFRSEGLPDPSDLSCLDIGASTGGFCDVLLRRGAGRVIALDVGHGQLDPRIADDPRIVEMSGVNIRDVHDGDLPYASALPARISCCWSSPSSRSAKDGWARAASWTIRCCARRRWTPSSGAPPTTAWTLWRPPPRRSKAPTATWSICCTRGSAFRPHDGIGTDGPANAA